MNVDQSQHLQCQVPVDISNPAVIAKIREFHAELASLDTVRCSICLEKFPSISLNDTSTCRRCHNDSHVPKLFSAANNMDPGSVPPELIVSNVPHTHTLITIYSTNKHSMYCCRIAFIHAGYIHFSIHFATVCHLFEAFLSMHMCHHVRTLPLVYLIHHI